VKRKLNSNGLTAAAPPCATRSRAPLRHAARSRTTRSRAARSRTRRWLRMYKGHGVIILVPTYEAAGRRADRLCETPKNVSCKFMIIPQVITRWIVLFNCSIIRLIDVTDWLILLANAPNISRSGYIPRVV